MKKMMKRMEDAAAAAAFAEEGEFETALSMVKPERRVLLALKEGRIDPRTVTYALNTAQRIGAHLDILYVSSVPAGAAIPGASELKHLAAGLEADGASFRITERNGCLKQAIIDYTDRQRNVLFVVVESPDSLDSGCRRKDSQLEKLWRNLKCPLVVVADGAGA